VASRPLTRRYGYYGIATPEHCEAGCSTLRDVVAVLSAFSRVICWIQASVKDPLMSSSSAAPSNSSLPVNETKSWSGLLHA